MERYRFGPYLLDPEKQRLLRNDIEIPLTPRRYQVLLVLIENAGQLVTKERLLNQIWGDTTIEESNLTQHVHNLRRLIEKDPHHPVFIRTIPGHGYKFAGSVLVTSSDEPLEEEVAPPLAAHPPSLPETRTFPRSYQADPWRKILVVLLLALLGGGSVLFLRSDRKRSDDYPTPITTHLTVDPGIESDPAFSPDGSMLAYSANGENPNQPAIFIKSLSAGITFRVSNQSGRDIYPVWSPDGKRLAFLRFPDKPEERFHVMTAPVPGGPEQEIGRAWGGLDWSPDGKYLAISDNLEKNQASQIHLVSLDGRERRKVTGNVSGRIVFENSPVFSPNGQELAFVRWESDVSGEIMVVDLSTGLISQVTNDQRAIIALDWTPEGDELIFVSTRSGNRRLWQTSRLDDKWSNPQLIDSISEEVDDFCISPRTADLAYSSSLIDTGIDIIGVSDSDKGSPTSGNCRINSSRDDSTQRFSPDGRQILFDSGRSGAHEIWIANRDCTGVHQLTKFNEPGVGSARWSPSGKKITFTRHLNGQSDIFAIDVDGQNLQRLTDDPGNDSLGCWSTDEESFFFTSIRSGTNQIWQMSAAGEVNGAEPIMLTTEGGRDPMPSPDGRYLYFTKNQFLYQLDLKTRVEEPVRELMNTVIDRYWDVTARSIYYVPVRRAGLPVIERLDLATRQIIPVLELKRSIPLGVSGVSVAEDGKLISITTNVYREGDIRMVRAWR